MRKLFLFLAVIFIVSFLIKRKDMTWRQSVLKAAYPLIMLKGKIWPGSKDIQENRNQSLPPVSFYSLMAVSNRGDTLDFARFKGKKVLIVNTASDCGFTAQYEELEKLYRQYQDKLVILAFPANDFKEQEKKDDAAIAEFCKVNYGVSFPIMQKSRVVKGAGQHAVFHWLSDPSANGWCSQQPMWNFSKYFIDERGILTHFYSQHISPLSKQVIAAIQ